MIEKHADVSNYKPQSVSTKTNVILTVLGLVVGSYESRDREGKSWLPRSIHESSWLPVSLHAML